MLRSNACRSSAILKQSFPQQRSCLDACKVVFKARCTSPTAAAPAFTAFDVLQTPVLQSIVTAGGSCFGPLQQSSAAYCQQYSDVWESLPHLPFSPAPILHQPHRQPPSGMLALIQATILGPSHAPLVSAGSSCCLCCQVRFRPRQVQAQLSKPLTQCAYQRLIDDPARSDRDRAVLHSVTQPEASDWLLALPDFHLHQTMFPESFYSRLQYQLLTPIFKEASQCPYSLRELDVWGDHAVHCTSAGDIAIVDRHYAVSYGRDVVLTSAGQHITREPAFPTPVPGQERRCATSVFMQGRRGAIFMSMLSAHRLLPLPISTILCRVGLPCVLLKIAQLLNMPSCWNDNNRLPSIFL